MRRVTNHLTPLILIVLVMMLFPLSSCGPSINQGRQALAREFGVGIEDYKYPEIFPLEYFEANLHTGATLIDVHAVIRGYERVVRCEAGSTREVYYYYSPDDSKSVRIEVWYDDYEKLVQINTEDQNSRGIQVEGCVPGRIGESSE